MAQQSTTGFGVAHPVPYSPPEKPKKDEKVDEDISTKKNK